MAPEQNQILVEANIQMARTVGVVFGLSILFTSLRYCCNRAPLYIVRDMREHPTNVKEHKGRKVTHSTDGINSILRMGLQNEHVRLFQDSSILQISYRVHQKSRKMQLKKHNITSSSFNKARIEKYITPLASCYSSQQKSGIFDPPRGPHTTRSLCQAPECLTFSLIRYELRQQLQTYTALQKFRQLMRSTWRIVTMVLPELSRTMAYTTRNRVNRLAPNELNLNPVVLERRSKEK